MNQDVTIRLTLAESLVLSDCLNRLNVEDRLTPFVDKAEQIALWALDCSLESANPVIFSACYDTFLQEAKAFITRGTDE